MTLTEILYLFCLIFVINEGAAPHIRTFLKKKKIWYKTHGKVSIERSIYPLGCYLCMGFWIGAFYFIEENLFTTLLKACSLAVLSVTLHSCLLFLTRIMKG